MKNYNDYKREWMIGHGYTLLDTIREDIKDYNKTEFVNTLCFELAIDGSQYGSLYYGGEFLYFGNLKEVNAVIKSLFRLREINKEV